MDGVPASIAVVAGSAAVPGRINPKTDHTTGSDHANRPPECWRVGVHKLRACPHIALHQPNDRSHTSFDHPNPVAGRLPVGCVEESPRSCTRWKKQRPRERGRPRPHQPEDRSYDRFRSRK
ncbi:MAG: hypothetical protein GX456_00415 [Verrucomicrobia bacterium]|nr:hypothetical protein [Verrucomicrobiota bacterium]